VDTTQELVAALTIDLDTAGVEIQETKRKLRQVIREKAILEAKLKEKQELPPEYDSDEPIEDPALSPTHKRLHYGEPGYRTRFR